jgi:Tat protein secretion system quality control protein TatD with DNase activity
VARELARVRNTSVEEIAHLTSTNFERLFGLGKHENSH